jgi:hypothetical protein
MSTLKNLLDNYGRSAEERAKATELINKVNKEAAENWHRPEWRKEMAAVLTQSILEGFQFETFYDQVVRVDRVGFTDRVFLQEETGLRVFYIAKGGHIEASSMVSEVMEIPRDTLGFHVYEFEDHMEANFAKTTAEMRSLIVRRLDFAVNQQIKALVEAAISNASPYYIAGAGLSQAALNQAIREVRDESLTGAVTIYGRPQMTEQITEFTGFADEALEEIRLRGRLGVYKGATIISVRNFTDQDGESYIPANELYVLANDAGLFATYGGLKTKEYVEADNWYWHYIGRQDFGGSIYRPERVRRFVDTSIDA